MKHIFIIGSKGIPARYGGFETFVENLTARRKNHCIFYHIACISGEGFKKDYNNAHCFGLKVPKIGAAKAVYYDIQALIYCIRYIKSNHIENPIIYILACRIGPFLGCYYSLLNKLGISIYVNPDGHEWKRKKWNYLIRIYWRCSERLMVKYADLLICDSLQIERYILNTYAVYHPKTTYIAYGAEASGYLMDDCSAFQLWLQANSLKKDEYYLMVGRFVQENNYETIIKEYMRSDTLKPLVIISNNETNTYYKKLRRKIKFETDRRIKFVGTVYDSELLYVIRKNAYGYIHGHEVGGTNPSLLEALSCTKVNLLLNVGFNREVGRDAVLYWTKNQGSLTHLINRAERLTKKQCEELGERAKKRIYENYSWNKIIDRYEALFIPEEINK